MTVPSANLAEPDPVGTESQPAAPLSRRSLLLGLAVRSLPRRLTMASAGIFAGIAALGPTSATAGNWACCTLARLDQWCGNHPGFDPPFWCNYGGFKRVWYCCEGGTLYGCGECQSGTGTCFNGPTWYCSYGWGINNCV
jgi:hypothetical protein